MGMRCSLFHSSACNGGTIDFHYFFESLVFDDTLFCRLVAKYQLLEMLESCSCQPSPK